MIEEMYGLVFDEVYVDEYDGSDALIFRNKDVEFRFCHYQDCCETVMIEEIFGDLSDLVGEQLYFLDESSAEEERNERAVWTFYKFGTRKGLNQ